MSEDSTCQEPSQRPHQQPDPQSPSPRCPHQQRDRPERLRFSSPDACWAQAWDTQGRVRPSQPARTSLRLVVSGCRVAPAGIRTPGEPSVKNEGLRLACGKRKPLVGGVPGGRPASVGAAGPGYPTGKVGGMHVSMSDWPSARRTALSPRPDSGRPQEDRKGRCGRTGPPGPLSSALPAAGLPPAGLGCPAGRTQPSSQPPGYS